MQPQSHPAPRIGQRLREIVPLSGHDVEDILNEQLATKSRFGEAAMALGMCRPEHVWRAYLDQASDAEKSVDLAAVGVDAQAVSLVPASLARRHGALPLRRVGNDLLLAVPPSVSADAVSEIEVAASLRAVCVTADPAALAALVRHYYPVAAA